MFCVYLHYDLCWLKWQRKPTWFVEQVILRAWSKRGGLKPVVVTMNNTCLYVKSCHRPVILSVYIALFDDYYNPHTIIMSCPSNSGNKNTQNPVAFAGLTVVTLIGKNSILCGLPWLSIKLSSEPNEQCALILSLSGKKRQDGLISHRHTSYVELQRKYMVGTNWIHFDFKSQVNLKWNSERRLDIVYTMYFERISQSCTTR